MKKYTSRHPVQWRRQALCVAIGGLLMVPVHAADTVGPVVDVSSNSTILPQSPASPVTTDAPRSVAFGQLNPSVDTIPDLVVANSGTGGTGNPGTVAVYFGTGSGEFTTGPIISVGGPAYAPYKVVIGDVDGGFPDIVTANQGNNSVTVIHSNGNGTFVARTPIAVGTQPTSVALGLINNDTFLDIVTANNGSANLTVLLNDGAGGGTFSAAANSPISLAGKFPRALALANLRNAGTLADIIVTNSPAVPGTVEVLLNDGTGLFAAPVSKTVMNNPNGVAVKALNMADPYPDVVVTNSGSNRASVFLTSSAGVLTPAATLTTGSQPAEVAIDDLNSDSLPDIVTVNAGSGPTSRISVFNGNGDGTFVLARNLAVGGNGPVGLAVADINNDTKPDFATADMSGGSASVRTNVSVLAVTFVGDVMHITPHARSNSIVTAGGEDWGDTIGYVLHYNTLTRYNTDPNRGWAIWGKGLRGDTLSINMDVTQTLAARAAPGAIGCTAWANSGTTAGDPISGALPKVGSPGNTVATCYRPIVVGVQSAGLAESYVYRLYAYGSKFGGTNKQYGPTDPPTEWQRP